MELSMSPRAANPSLAKYKFVPFTATLRVVPYVGNREETRYSLEEQRDTLAAAIESACGTDTGYSFDFAKPIAIAPAFGDRPARLTVTGHACKRTEFTKLPVGTQTVDGDEGAQIGYGPSNASNRVPNADVDDVCLELKDILESTGLAVIRMEVANFAYGVKGVHFPRG